MATRKTTSQPIVPVVELEISREEFKSKISQRILEGERIYSFKVTNFQDFEKNRQEYYDWNDWNSEFLKASFNFPNNDYRTDYERAGYVGFFAIGGGPPPSLQERVGEFKEEVESKISNLKRLAAKTDLLKCYISAKQKVGNSSNRPSIIEASSNIFIVHGHNDGVLSQVARTVQKLGLNPIILHEKANEGRTIIEKFEVHAEVGFAIVLMTCDDFGRAKGTKDEKPRARQNVILELGYFIGKIGREKVFPLYEEGVELPSDLHGLLYTLIEKSDSWKFSLAKELKAAGYTVDVNAIL